MGIQQWAGLTLITGFLSILVATFVGPPRLFQEQDSAARLAIIAGHPARWLASNFFYALGGVLTALGLGLYSLQFQGTINVWVNRLAAAAINLGTVAWVVLMARRAANPEPYFQDYTFSPFTAALLWLTLIGLLLYGIAFLQAGNPSWLAISTIAGMVLIGGAALLFPNRFYAAFPPQVFYLFTLAAGIVLMRQ